jgi:purine-binding chemotaxis protein CheW
MADLPTGPGKKILEQVRRAQRNHLESEATDSPLQQYLSFRLKEEWYAVSVSQLVEVLPPPKITRVPSVPDHILGVMNLRGEVLSVIDLKRFFGLDPGDPGADHVIVVVEYGGMRTGLLVDSIGDLVNLATGELSEEPLLPGKSQRGFFEGAALRDEVLVSIIRLEGILESEGMYSRQG